MKLKDIAEIVSGGTPLRANPDFWKNGDIPWIKISDIKSKYIEKAEEFITKEGLDNSSAKLLNKGTILYTIFATLGEVGILQTDACTNQAIAGISIINSKEISPEYIYYFLKSKKNYINSIGRGVAQNNINLSILRNLDIKPTGISEQNGIIENLKRVERIITLREKQLQKLDLLIRARFGEMFGDPVENDRQWKTEKLSTIMDVRDGTHDSPKYFDRGYPFVTSKNLVNGKIDFSTCLFISKVDYDNYNKRSNVDDGDILMPMIGSVGGAIIVNKDRDFAIKNVALIKNIKNKKIVNSIFVLRLLNSEEMFLNFDNIKKGGTQKFISLNLIRNLSIILPPTELQNQFAEFVEKVNKTKEEVQKALDKTKLLFDSLMQEYFKN